MNEQKTEDDRSGAAVACAAIRQKKAETERRWPMAKVTAGVLATRTPGHLARQQGVLPRQYAYSLRFSCLAKSSSSAILRDNWTSACSVAAAAQL